jgi:[protein-PII] uridylyltransferase
VLPRLPRRLLETGEVAQLVRAAQLLAQAKSTPEVAFHDAPDSSFTEVLVFEPTYPGLLAQIAVALNVAGLDIRKATSAPTPDGGTLDLFEVCTADTAHGALPARRRDPVAQEILGGLSGQRSLDEILQTKLGQSRLPPRQRPDVKLQVTVDNDFDPAFTILEVKAPDRPGLLAHIARTLSNLALRLDRSIITTEGDRAIDAFYVADQNGNKLDEAQAQNACQVIAERLKSLAR